MSEYRCNGCGELNTIEEFSLVPRAVTVNPGDGIDEYGNDEAFWEAETVIGYRCSNVTCKFHGYAEPSWNRGETKVTFAALHRLEKIAKEEDADASDDHATD